jgi:hypothetical protein
MRSRRSAERYRRGQRRGKKREERRETGEGAKKEWSVNDNNV